MRKKIMVISLVIVAVILVAGIAGGIYYKKYIYKPTHAVDHVHVYIDKNFKQQFLNQEFTVEDFNWNNIESLEYKEWNDFLESGEIEIYLKRQGEKQVLSAVEHLKQVEFVKHAELHIYIYAY